MKARPRELIADDSFRLIPETIIDRAQQQRDIEAAEQRRREFENRQMDMFAVKGAM